MDPRFVATKNGLPGTAQVEGTSVVGGIAATPGSAGGTPQIVSNANPAVKSAMIAWGIAIGVLFIFHVGGAHLG